jgi:chromosomal replication initiation ATPase DnaA
MMNEPSYAFNQELLDKSIAQHWIDHPRVTHLTRREMDVEVYEKFMASPEWIPADVIVPIEEVAERKSQPIMRRTEMQVFRYSVLAVAEHFGVKPVDVMIQNNRATGCYMRRMVVGLARKYSGVSYSAMGRYMRKHHTTVMSSMVNFEADMRKEGHRQVFEQIEAIFQVRMQGKRRAV